MVCRTAINQTTRSGGTDEKVASLKAARAPASDDESVDDPGHPDAPYPVATKYPRKWR